MIRKLFKFDPIGSSSCHKAFWRVINLVVVSSTMAVAGLAFFTYGFTMVGTCVEIGLPQILIIVFFFPISSKSLNFLVTNSSKYMRFHQGLQLHGHMHFYSKEVGVYYFSDCKYERGNF
ncbi:hypothetical protein SUGI_0154070 [Cryptomeria japonica]|nr:hypothetical protein SUGI_0154070 [Cryptomeria japonica]